MAAFLRHHRPTYSSNIKICMSIILHINTHKFALSFVLLIEDYNDGLIYFLIWFSYYIDENESKRNFKSSFERRKFSEAFVGWKLKFTVQRRFLFNKYVLLHINLSILTLHFITDNFFYGCHAFELHMKDMEKRKLH